MGNGFKARQDLEGIGPYDFRPYFDESGPIPEPDTELIADYLSAFDSMLRSNARQLEEWQERLKSTPKEALPELDAEFEQWQRKSGDETQMRRRELLAKLCSDSPSFETLKAIPGRLFDAFEQYVQDQLTPKALKNATNE